MWGLVRHLEVSRIRPLEAELALILNYQGFPVEDLPHPGRLVPELRAIYLTRPKRFYLTLTDWMGTEGHSLSCASLISCAEIPM